MPGANCSVFGCPVCLCKEYRGISLFKVPTGKNDFDTNWRTRLVAVITEDRVVDASLQAQVERNNLYIYVNAISLKINNIVMKLKSRSNPVFKSTTEKSPFFHYNETS